MPLRRRPRLVLAGAIIALLAVVAIASAALTGRAKPPRRSLAAAVHRALTAKPVAGVTARIKLTDKLVDTGALPRGMSSPLLAGASGRAWWAADGRFRLELQSANGDNELVSDGHRLTFYDAKHDTVYTLPLPAEGKRAATNSRRHEHGAPTLADVRRGLAHLAGHAAVSGARPTDVAGRPAYSVTVAPKRNGGLLGHLALAWDADHGVPLRVAVTARGAKDPVLALEATDIDYGRVPASVLAPPDPPGAKHVRIELPTGGAHHATRREHTHAEAKTLAAVRRRAAFTVAAPARLGGLKRSRVHLASKKVVATYGTGLGGLLVVESRAGREQPSRRLDQLPSVPIGSAAGHELPTALGTVVTWTSGGVAYVVAGPHPTSTVVAAARELAGP
jgi:hypothetical protein